MNFTNTNPDLVISILMTPFHLSLCRGVLSLHSVMLITAFFARLSVVVIKATFFVVMVSVVLLSDVMGIVVAPSSLP
jgi:hypothetical protein